MWRVIQHQAQSLLRIKQEKLLVLLSSRRDEKHVEDVLMMHALFTPFPWSYSVLPGGAFLRLLHLFPLINWTYSDNLCETSCNLATGCTEPAGLFETAHIWQSLWKLRWLKLAQLFKILKIFPLSVIPCLPHRFILLTCSAMLKLDSRYFKLCFVISFRKDSWGFVLLMKPNLNDFTH